MRLYLAGVLINTPVTSNTYRRLNEAELIARTTPEWYLESYHYVNKEKHVAPIRQEGRKLFLDSGAFSAFTLGKKISLDGYCRFIHDNQDVIEIASVLDGIGDAQKTWDNQMEMERQGTTPLPCFHYGEDESYLEKYIERYDHITLGGMVPIPNKQLDHWLERIWADYLTDENGWPKLKVHGFGMTSLPLMMKYPWYSVDSSSWVQQGKVGSVVIDLGGVRPAVIQMSSSSASLKEEGKHFTTLTLADQKPIRDKLAEDGFDPERLGDHYLARWTYNMLSYYRLGERTHDHPYIQPQIDLGLF